MQKQEIISELCRYARCKSHMHNPICNADSCPDHSLISSSSIIHTAPDAKYVPRNKAHILSRHPSMNQPSSDYLPKLQRRKMQTQMPKSQLCGRFRGLDCISSIIGLVMVTKVINVTSDIRIENTLLGDTLGLCKSLVWDPFGTSSWGGLLQHAINLLE